MIGKRVDQKQEVSFPYPALGPGEYGKDLAGVWHCRPPWKHAAGGVANHAVTEHEDGTITVTPSIKITCWAGFEEDGKEGNVTWHGYLERGVWREC